MKKSCTNIQPITFLDTGTGALAVYDIYDTFSNKKKFTEFCFAPKPLHYEHFNYNVWLNLINSILCIVLKTKPTGSQGTYTNIDINILNKRVVEPGDRLTGAENIFNSRNQYVHGTVKVINSISSENGFVALDVEFKLLGDLGNARFKILRK
ncbi:MAG: hypothetical protein QG594_704 [Bacteroidota bacterium]|nr:hypothetical protein [Bacteroidota bacterium]